ncbi:MAG: triose-phosphate isomerase [Candidatus Omnitrophota bacterium]|nr:triose-phosphate isomerase [Candidatus Omnitrophota bacterium]
MRKLIIAGNWKMFKTILEAIDLANGLKRNLFDVTTIDIVICPAFTSLAEVYEVISGSNLQLGAQDMHWEEQGAFTGGVSGLMVKDAGADFVILGHSERRIYFGETSQSVNKKIKAALKFNLTPIVCVGENLSQREENRTFEVIKQQLEECLDAIEKEEARKLVIAYEPVWAIGTGKTALPKQAQEVHKYIRSLLVKFYDEDLAGNLRIQYGGSVKPENIFQLISEEDIDGALVGGASLDAELFTSIVRNSLKVGK